jgi:hypothetical protein
LRGEHLLMRTDNAGRIQDLNWWLKMTDDYHLNAVRLLCYRDPMGIPGYSCDPVSQCIPVQEVIPLLDTAVARAKQVGMYVIIDYHPVNGLNLTENLNWWSVIAPRYKDETHVIYEAANEPGIASGANQLAMYNHIRALAPNTHIILWSFAVAHNTYNGHPEFQRVYETTGIDYSNASVAFHPYSYSLSDIRALRTAGYPLIMNEIWQFQSSPGFYQGHVNLWEFQENMSWVVLSCYPRCTDIPQPAINCTDLHKDHFAGMNINWPKDPKTGLVPSSVDEGKVIPKTFDLHQNFPNPFNPTTRIAYDLPVSRFVKLKVFDTQGREMASLAEHNHAAGRHEIEIDAAGWPSGVYFLKLAAGEYLHVRKMVLVK